MEPSFLAVVRGILESNGQIRIGRGTGSAAIGDYAEVMIITSVDATMKEKMEGYLMHKWGLANNLPSAHSYKTSPVSTTSWSDAQSFTTCLGSCRFSIHIPCI